MMKSLAAAAAFAVLLASGAAMAQTDTVPGHPAVNEVDQRLQNQENHTDAGVANGTINAQQESRDQARDAKVSSQMSADEAKNGGHLTPAETVHMNRELDKNAAHIHHQRHGKTTTTPPVTQ